MRVKRPGLRVSARKGYLAPDDAAPPPASFSGLGPELSELVRRPMSTLGLPLSAMAVPLPIEFDNVTVTVEVGAQALGFDERDGRHENTVDLAIVPVGIGGTVYPLVNGPRPAVAAAGGRRCRPPAGSAHGRAADAAAPAPTSCTSPRVRSGTGRPGR